MNLFQKPWFLVLLIIPFFPPVIVKVMPQYEQIDKIYSIARVVSFLFILWQYIRRRKISKIIISIAYFELLLVLVTFYRQGNIGESVINFGTIIGFCILIEIGLDGLQKELFSALFYVLSTLILVNFVLLLKYPEGIYQDVYYWNTYNFLAIDNGLAKTLLPTMTIGALYGFVRGKKSTMFVWVVNICISITMILTWSATGVIGWFILAFFLLFAYQKRLEKIFRFNTLFVISGVLFFFIMSSRTRDIFAFITEGILGKSSDFSSRPEIWSLAYERFLSSPLFGYGIPYEQGLVYWRGIYVYAHNAILEVLLQGGIVGLVLYFVIFILAGKQLMKFKDNSLSCLLSANLFAFSVMMLMEPHTNSVLLYGLLIISFHIQELVEKKQEASCCDLKI